MLLTKPTNLSRTTALLQRIFDQQATEAMRRLSPDHLADARPPDLAHWIGATADAVRPLLLQHWQEGMVQSQRRIAALLGGMKPGHYQPRRVMLHPEHTFSPNPIGPPRAKGSLFSLPRLYWPSSRFSHKKQMGSSFDLFSPRVLNEVDAATMLFCRETNATATSDLKIALRQLRAALKQGLEAGEAFRALTRRVREIFSDPARAYRIALTESVRALQHGSLFNAKESGVVSKKSWLASPAACPRCQELEDRGEIDLDEPFLIDGTGPYSRIMAPPLHPH